jgi:hypothetical protein
MHQEGVFMVFNFREFSKVNLACGRNPLNKFPSPWLNVDVSPDIADFCSDVRQLPAEWNNYFSEVRASHVLEHLFLNDMQAAVLEWARVIKPGGTIRIIVPDVKIIAQSLLIGTDPKSRNSESIKETTAVFAQIYGVGYDSASTEHPWRHRFMFSELTLSELLASAGIFDQIQIYAKSEDPAASFGIVDDSQNCFSLCIKARKI